MSESTAEACSQRPIFEKQLSIAVHLPKVKFRPQANCLIMSSIQKGAEILSDSDTKGTCMHFHLTVCA